MQQVGETDLAYVRRYLIEHLKGLDFENRKRDANAGVQVDGGLITP